jgi:hypothetical protein
MFQVFDNIIDEKEQTELSGYFLNSVFPYYLSAGFNFNTVSQKLFEKNKDLHTKESKLLVHTFYNEGKVISHSYSIVEALLHKFIIKTNLNFKTIFRAKLNLQFKNENYDEKNYTTPHIDSTNEHKVLIYYPINSDGNTILFKKENEKYTIIDKIEPKQGRFLLFDGNTYHAAQPPMKNDFRLTLNFNII